MANLEQGYELCQHITDTLNNIINKTGRQIDKNEPEIWDGFLHQASNQDWEDMFAAFKHMISNSEVFLENHQQCKFDEAYTTFQRDKNKRERCMDIRNKYKNTKYMAWSMIMIIREVVNAINGVKISNTNSKDIPDSKIKQSKHRMSITITFDTLFDVED